MKEYCPICDCQMKLVAGNVYTCQICDFTATDHQLKRIRQVELLPQRVETPRTHLRCE